MMVSSSFENYFDILNDPVRTIDSSLRTTTHTKSVGSLTSSCPATAALEILIGKDVDNDNSKKKKRTMKSTPRQENQSSLLPSPMNITDDDPSGVKPLTDKEHDFGCFPLIGWYSGDDDDDDDNDDDDSAESESGDRVTFTLPSNPLSATFHNYDVQTEQIEDKLHKATTTMTTNNTSTTTASAGKRCRSSSSLSSMRKSQTRLVRSIALNSHLSLLESSFEPLQQQREPRTVSEGSSSSNSLTKKFDVEKWLSAFDQDGQHHHDDDNEMMMMMMASPNKMRKTLRHRVQDDDADTSINETIHGLALISTT